MTDASCIDDRVTVFEAAQLCGVKPGTVRQWIYRGLLPVAERYHGRRLLLNRLDVAKAQQACQAESRAEREHVVYYVQFSDRIKIGTSICVLGRLDNIPHDTLLAIEPGREVEQQRRREFADDRLTGEWFRPSPALLAHIDGLRGELITNRITS